MKDAVGGVSDVVISLDVYSCNMQMEVGLGIDNIE
jgi:hypothetical protein